MARVQDRVVGENDPVGNPRRVEHQYISTVFSVVGERIDVEATECDALTVVGPRCRGVVDRVAGAGQLQVEVEDRGTLGQPLRSSVAR